MRKLTSIVLFIILCMPQCTLLKRDRSVSHPERTIIVPVKEIPKTPVATVIPIDTSRPQIKTVYINQTVPDKNYYSRMDSLINKRMGLFADSNRLFIGSQTLVLADYKSVLISNVKLIDSLKKAKHEKTILRNQNIQKQETINDIGKIDYYTANIAWATMMIMLIFGLYRQSQMKREILRELKAV